MTFLMMFICSMLSMCDQASDLWQQVELASELESDLQDWAGAGSGLLILMLEKTQLVLFDRSYSTDAIDVKMFWRKNHILRCWGCLSLLNWIFFSYFI